MNDEAMTKNAQVVTPADLTAAVAGRQFSTEILNYVSQTARIRNFVVIYFPDLSAPKGIQSMWAGEVGDYWFRRTGETVIRSDEVLLPVYHDVCSTERLTVQVERLCPGDGDPLRAIFDKFGILERITSTGRNDSSGYQCYFHRSRVDGPVSDQSFLELSEILPFVHELVGLRHHMVGSEDFLKSEALSASPLRESGVDGFVNLSLRETEICDAMLDGQTVAAAAIKFGVAETTVKTLRRRVFRKLGLKSAAEVLALVIKVSRDTETYG